MTDERLEYSIGVKGRKLEDAPRGWKKFVKDIPGMEVVKEEAQSLQVLMTRADLQVVKDVLGEEVFHIRPTVKAPPKGFFKTKVF